MTRYDDRDRIATNCTTDSLGRHFWSVELLGNLARDDTVTRDLTVRDFAENAPDGELEGRTVKAERDFVRVRVTALEVGAEPRFCLRKNRRRLENGSLILDGLSKVILTLNPQSDKRMVVCDNGDFAKRRIVCGLIKLSLRRSG